MGVSPWWWGGSPYWYYPDPYYGYPYYPYGQYGYPSSNWYEPPVYIEQSPAPPTAYWYYCQNPAGYYPWVEQCTQWLLVSPQPSR